MKPAILVSRCLLGEPCRYDGGDNRSEAVCRLASRYRIIAICPECDGGLPTPRTPSERQADRVVMRDGSDVTAAFLRGAEHALALAREHRIAFAVLKARSPSCGRDVIYDGSFSRSLVERSGVTAELLLSAGYRVLTETEIERETE